MLIDVHHHATTEALTARRARAGLAAPPGMPAWTREIAVETMDSIGVTASVLSVPADLGWLPEHDRAAAARDINDELAGIVAWAPQRFGAFATIPLPDPDAALEETGRAVDDLGLDGVCLLSSYDGGSLTDERYTDLLAEWNRRQLVVFVHPILLPGPVAGLSPALLPYVKWRIALNALQPGDFRVPVTREAIDREIAVLDALYYDTTLNLGPLPKLARADRILFGTDVPWANPDVLRLQVEDIVDDATASGDALRLFPRLAARLSGG